MTISKDRLREIVEDKYRKFGWQESRDMAIELLAAQDRIAELIDWGATERARAEVAIARAEKAAAEVERLRAELADLRLAMSYGGCSAVHAAKLREIGMGWAVDAVAYRDRTEAALSSLREAVKFYDAARASGKEGKMTGAVRDGLDWIIDSARSLARDAKGEAK